MQANIRWHCRNYCSALSPVVDGVFNTIGIVSTVMGVVSDVISSTLMQQGAWEGLKGFVSGVFDGVAAVESFSWPSKGICEWRNRRNQLAISIINKIPGVSIGSIPYR